ncbi:MAG: MFS transporter [Armatimonadetes bacterium]|nr:MFS transporter [Armatimonadota bacterium]
MPSPPPSRFGKGAGGLGNSLPKPRPRPGGGPGGAVGLGCLLSKDTIINSSFDNWRKRLGDSFPALGHRNYRLFWTGSLVSQIGSWLQSITYGWLVYKLTRDAWQIGFIGFLGSLPMLLFSLLGGVAADRLDKRRFITLTQTVFMTTAFILSALVYWKAIQVWHVAVIALVNGTMMAFDNPARQALVQDLVGKEDLINGIALNSAAFNGARVLGPALAGILVAHFGMAICFFLNGLSFLFVIAALLMIRTQPPPLREDDHNVWAHVKEGLLYIRRHPVIRVLIAMVGVRSVFGLPYAILMPMMAGEVLHVDAAGLGKLMSATGVGALIGALGTARFGDRRHKGLTLLRADIAFACALTAFSLSRNFHLSLAFLVLLGASWVTYMTTMNTLIQTLSQDRLRGRVISVYMMVFGGMTPLANLQAGAVARALGVPAALLIGGLACGLSAAWVALFREDIRRLK